VAIRERFDVRGLLVRQRVEIGFAGEPGGDSDDWGVAVDSQAGGDRGGLDK
jgi:hypothetical protein